ncbi:MAG: sigma 54-interacting transcriptional regulator [Sphingomonadales bacterium]|nr:sigma 54-interacting transcriptional regulator [Sphingomonadales bacterium]
MSATPQGLEFTPETARRHAPLVQRAEAIVSSLGCAEPVWLADAAEAMPSPPRKNSVTLARGQVGGIRRDGARRYAVAYRDAVGDAALGALVACVSAAQGEPWGAPIAADPESLSVLALAERLAASEIPVLINGPTGTGKEVLSRFIHARSPRKEGPFIAVNCAAMPEAMLEAMLFGHVKGAFTGATQSSDGFFRAADGGTLLLDEIAEMPLPLQAKLLRALQEGEVVPIGATIPVKVDVRVIAAANRDLPTEVAEGRFRADLFYRLNVFPLALRALRDRAEDVTPLAFAMLMRHTPAGQPVPWISDAALAMLRLHPWPGNVRELENVMRRALLLCGGAEIEPGHIQFDSIARLVGAPAAAVASAFVEATEPAGNRRLANVVQLSEARAIMDALDACNGNRVAAARQLGISERTLRYRLAAFREAGIPVSATRGANAGHVFARVAGSRS